MITGFNPADMYAADHIRRVLETYPGVFTGIGEFTIHKEFVSSKVAGDTASLTTPRSTACSISRARWVSSSSSTRHRHAVREGGCRAVFLTQMKDLLRRHPKTTIIWSTWDSAGRQPVQDQASSGTAERSPRFRDIVASMLADPTLSHVYFDISWDEVAKYAVSSPESIRNTAALLNRYPDRILFGTDNVAPAEQATQLRVYNLWDPIWAELTPEASLKIRKGNYERLFDAARLRVRPGAGQPEVGRTEVIMDTHASSESSISRRRVLAGSAAFLAGSGAGAGITALAAAPQTPATAPPLPWKWVKLDPLEAAGVAIVLQGKGWLRIGQLPLAAQPVEEKVGHPWTTMPDMLMVHAAAGFGGHGTLCGALAGRP